MAVTRNARNVRRFARTRRRLGKPRKTRITPADRPIEARIFLAALAAGESVPAALKLSGLSERRVARWIAFCAFGPAVQRAKRRGRRTRLDISSNDAIKSFVELNYAIHERQIQRDADRYAGGDRRRLEEMRISGDLDRIWIDEAIDTLRRHGKHELADYHEHRFQSVLQPRTGGVPGIGEIP